MFDFNCIVTVFLFDIASDITCNVAVELLATTMFLVPLSYDMLVVETCVIGYSIHVPCFHSHQHFDYREPTALMVHSVATADGIC